jgi:beta-1,4-mannosyltransferase
MRSEIEHVEFVQGAADLGVCLHTSTSNLDLPMKVVDMFGCGVPVCAVHFDCLAELVRHEHNGLVFRSSGQLAQQCESLLHKFPTDTVLLSRLESGVKDFQACRWQENWDSCARPIFEGSKRSSTRVWFWLAVFIAALAVRVWIVTYP